MGNYAFAQVERWVYRYNGPGNGDDAALAIVHGADTNLYAAGWSTGTLLDFTVMSLTSSGTERWLYQQNGTGNYKDVARSIIYGVDNNIYAAGYIYYANRDFTVMSFTSTGNQRWIYKYNGPNNSNDNANSVIYGADGKLYVAGASITSTFADFTIISLTTEGTQRWVYTYNGPANLWDEAFAVVYGADGNLYAAGFSDRAFNNYDFVVISLDTTGTERWVYRYNSPEDRWDEARSIVYGADGNLYAAGQAGLDVGSNSSSDFTVVSLTNAGAERWVYRYNGPGNNNDCAHSIVYGPDGSLYAVGYSDVAVDNADFTVISLTTTGTERWVYRYNGPGDGQDDGLSIVYGPDGYLYAAGYSTGDSLDFTVLSLTNLGDERWVYRYNGPGNSEDKAYSIIYGIDGNCYAAGSSVGTSGLPDWTVISIDPSAGIEEQLSSSPPTDRFIILTPFFQEKISIKFTSAIDARLKITLYNSLGRMVYQNSVFAAAPVLTLKDEGILQLPQGSYFISISAGKKNYPIRKIIKP